MVSDSFTAAPNEGFFGFGGRHLDLDHRKKVIANRVSKQNTSLAGWSAPADVERLGVTLFPNGPNAAYYPSGSSCRPRATPSWSADRGDPVPPHRGRSRPLKRRRVRPGLAYVVAPGSVRAAIGTLAAFIGRQRVSLDWVLGAIMDRIKTPSMTAEEYAELAREDLANIER